VLAHNFQGYDGYFVAAEYRQNSQIVQQIRNGCKLLELKHDQIRFIDSMSFFQMPLSAFPKTFGLMELKKGYFPHKFNLLENQEYVGIVPAIDYYMPESMSPEGREEFEKWHKDQRNKNTFNFQEELIAYCESDVRLLKQGCMTFKLLFEAKTGFNPFDHITIASACNRDLRMNRMIPNSIASEPVNGWRTKINQSRAAFEWLTWCNYSLREVALNNLTEEELSDHDMMSAAYPLHEHPSHCVYVQHAGNAGEYRIPNTSWFVDGYCKDTNTVYEFHGCFWHGCPKCYPVRGESHLRLSNRTMRDVYEKTQQRTKNIQARGYNVIEMRECEWSRLKKHRGDIRTCVEQLEFSDPLRKSITLITRLCIPGSTKPVFIPKDIPPLSLNQTPQTSTSTLASSNAKSSPPMVCTILYYPTATGENSPFLSVLPVWKRKWKSHCWKGRPSAPTRTTNAH